MFPTFPEEILDHIVGLVPADGRRDSIKGMLSLCLANKVLLPISQSYLYRDITIYPHTDDPQLEYLTEYRTMRTRTQLLVRTILDKPSLGTHVQKLVIYFTIEPKVGGQYVADIASTFEYMNRIRDLRIIYKPLEACPRTNEIQYGCIESAFGSKALEALVSWTSLESITFHKTRNCPFYMVPLTPALRHLDLMEATLSADSGRDVKLSTKGAARLSSLRVDSMSVDEWIIPFNAPGNGEDQDTSQTRLDISEVEMLDVGLPRLVTEAGLLGWRDFILVSITHSLLRHYTAVKNPYGCVWDDVLTQFVQLQVSLIPIVIEGDLDFDVAESLGPEWGTLPDPIYTHPRACPSLKEFRLSLLVRVDDDSLKEDIVGAKAFLEAFTTTTYPRYIHPGRYARNEGRRISFSFKVDYRVGGMVEPYFIEEYV